MHKLLYTLSLSMILFSCADFHVGNLEPTYDTIDYYELDSGWVKFPAGYALGNPTGIGIDSDNHLWVFHRAGRQWSEPFPDSAISANTIMEIDTRTGEVLRQWGAGIFIMPHGLNVDKDNFIWLTDVARHQVYKYDRDGNLLMTIGENKVPGDDSLHFNKPTDVAVAEDGSFYVSDGYGNSRVVKYSADGNYILQWGKPGSNDADFNLPHAIDIDSSGFVYVADRENMRIQKFNADGVWMDSWKDEDEGKIYSVVIKPHSNCMAMVDYKMKNDTTILGSDLIVSATDLQSYQRFGRSGDYDGGLCRYHDVEVDSSGNFYTADILFQQLQRFRKTMKIVER